MFKKIAAAAVLAGALAFSAAAPAVLSASSTPDNSGIAVVATGIWPDPMAKTVKPIKPVKDGKTYTTNTGIWPDPA
jgi:hypothetical protein